MHIINRDCCINLKSPTLIYVELSHNYSIENYRLITKNFNFLTNLLSITETKVSLPVPITEKVFKESEKEYSSDIEIGIERPSRKQVSDN